MLTVVNDNRYKTLWDNKWILGEFESLSYAGRRLDTADVVHCAKVRLFSGHRCALDCVKLELYFGISDSV